VLTPRSLSGEVRCGQAGRVTASCLVFFSGHQRDSQGTTDALSTLAMRYEDEEDPKKPRPVSRSRKGDGVLESQEYGPREVNPSKDDDYDRHRHVRL
jgi:hypothetical protein